MAEGGEESQIDIVEAAPVASKQNAGRPVSPGVVSSEYKMLGVTISAGDVARLALAISSGILLTFILQAIQGGNGVGFGAGHIAVTVFAGANVLILLAHFVLGIMDHPMVKNLTFVQVTYGIIIAFSLAMLLTGIFDASVFVFNLLAYALSWAILFVSGVVVATDSPFIGNLVTTSEHKTGDRYSLVLLSAAILFNVTVLVAVIRGATGMGIAALVIGLVLLILTCVFIFLTEAFGVHQNTMLIIATGLWLLACAMTTSLVTMLLPGLVAAALTARLIKR